MKILTKISAAIMLSLSMSAHAGAIIDFDGTGVDFYASWLNEVTLRIEIDAGSLTVGGGWEKATNIDSIAINGGDAWSWAIASDITLNGPNSSFDGNIDGTGLNANGCQALSLGKNHQCWMGLEKLADDMIFDFTFSDKSLISSYIDNPHLKVRLVDDNGNKIGSLLSANVPEPSVLLLMGAGLFGLGFALRSRTKKA